MTRHDVIHYDVLLLHPRKVITLHSKQREGSRKFQELKMEPEFMSGEEFLRSIEARLARMEEMANAFHDCQTDYFRRELEDKQLRQSIAKTTVCCNKSQNNGSTENGEMAKLLKIYDPDRGAELSYVFRYREYSEELETIEEMDYDDDVHKENACDKEFAPRCKYGCKCGAEYLDWLRNQLLHKEDFDKRYDDQVESSQKFAVEFETGTEYLRWLKLQLPYVEPFQHQDETHYYFFRKWRKDDLKYYAEMDCIDPFAPNDAVHFYFKRRWSREKCVASVDVLEEVETLEETTEEQVYEAPQIEPDYCSTEKTQEPEQDTLLPVEVNEHLDKERKVKDESFAAGPLLEQMKNYTESTEEKRVKKHQKKGRNFLRRLFGR